MALDTFGNRDNLEVGLEGSFLRPWMCQLPLTWTQPLPSQAACQDLHPNIASSRWQENLGSTGVFRASDSVVSHASSFSFSAYYHSSVCHNDYKEHLLSIYFSELKKNCLKCVIYLSDNSRCHFWETEVWIWHITAVYLPQANSKTIDITFSIIWAAIENLLQLQVTHSKTTKRCAQSLQETKWHLKSFLKIPVEFESACLFFSYCFWK